MLIIALPLSSELREEVSSSVRGVLVAFQFSLPLVFLLCCLGLSVGESDDNESSLSGSAGTLLPFDAVARVSLGLFCLLVGALGF